MSLGGSSMYGQMHPLERDPALQWKWHEAYRDMSKNMYRTSYTDMTHFREVNVKSNFPAGYGGHVPLVRHDILYRNTEFDRKLACMRADPSRDAKPSFEDQICGVPTITRLPCGAPKNPTKGVCYHDGTTRPLAPWGITVDRKRDVLSQRCIPPTMKRTYSEPGMARSNSAAMGAANFMMGGATGSGDGQYGAPPTQMPHQHQQSQPMRQFMDEQVVTSPNAERLRRTVDFANEEAKQGRMPTEAEILHEQIGR